MAKAWSGDGTYVLPARKVEPYRLWFEFLKLAINDPEIKVDKRIYKSWGDVENLTFDKWWSDHWRDLFAVETGIRMMERDETLGKSNNAVAVRVPLALDANTAIQELKELLHEHGIGNREATRVKGKFALTEGSKQGFEKRMNTARCMLRLYGYWLKYQKADKRKRVEKAALDYYDWAYNWNQQIVTKGWKRTKPDLQACFSVYCEYLTKRDAGDLTYLGKAHGYGYTLEDPSSTALATGQRAVGGIGLDGEDARRHIVRYIKKARNIAENVASGEFPGKY
jgi:hypothetical protein